MIVCMYAVRRRIGIGRSLFRYVLHDDEMEAEE